jgi:hypothetical protein
MVRISTAISAFVLILVSGCAKEQVSGPIELLKVDAEANPCGQWQVQIRAQGHAGSLVLEVDGHRHREWAVDGEVDLEATGQARPRESVSIDLIASNMQHQLQVQMPDLIANLTATLPASVQPGTETPLTLQLDSPCLLRVAIQWELELDGQTIHSGRFIPGTPEKELILPPLEPGNHALKARASWSDTEVSTWSQDLVIPP